MAISSGTSDTDFQKLKEVCVFVTPSLARGAGNGIGKVYILPVV